MWHVASGRGSQQESKYSAETLGVQILQGDPREAYHTPRMSTVADHGACALRRHHPQVRKDTSDKLQCRGEKSIVHERYDQDVPSQSIPRSRTLPEPVCSSSTVAISPKAPTPPDLTFVPSGKRCEHAPPAMFRNVSMSVFERVLTHTKPRELILKILFTIEVSRIIW